MSVLGSMRIASSPPSPQNGVIHTISSTRETVPVEIVEYILSFLGEQEPWIMIHAPDFLRRGAVYILLDRIRMVNYVPLRELRLSFLCQRLAEAGDPDHAFTLAQEISSEHLICSPIRTIYQTFVQYGCPDKAFAAAHKLPTFDHIRCRAFEQIATQLTKLRPRKQRFIDKALESVKYIDQASQDQKSQALYQIVRCCIQQDKILEAVLASHVIPCKGMKNHCLDIIKQHMNGPKTDWSLD